MSLFFRKWWRNTTKLISDLHFFCDPWGYLHFFWHIFSLEWYLSPRLGSYTVLLPQYSMGWDNHKGLPMFTGRRHRSHNSMRGASRWHCKKTMWDKRYGGHLCKILSATVYSLATRIHIASACKICLPLPQDFQVSSHYSICSKFSILSFKLGLVSSWAFSQIHQL